MSKLAAILYEIQKDLKAPKEQYNSFAKYNYRSCEDIVEAVKKVMPAGYALVMSDNIEIYGQHLYVKATVKLIGIEGDVIEATGCAREALDKKGMDAAQMTGTASSYARKYALNGLFAIDDTKDADSYQYKEESNARAAKVSKAPKVVTPQDTADRLIAKAKEFKEFKALKAWTDLQAVKDARDKLFNDDKELSEKVEAEINKLTEALP